MEKIILASSSPRRKEILQMANIKFTVITADGEEIIEESSPAEAVERLAKGKALAVAEKPEAKDGQVIIGADTVVAYEGRILGKPSDKKDAVHTLKMLQGNVHQVYTGVAILVKKEEVWEMHTFHECTDVHFYPVTDEEIRRYVESGEPMDKAGSYGIQGSFGAYLKEIRGDYYNVVGLPAGRLIYEMKKMKLM